MKRLFIPALAAALLCSLIACENKTATIGNQMPSDNASGTTFENGPLPPGRNDSLAGFQGCERAAYSALTANSHEFIYQHYTVKIKENPNSPGEEVVVVRDSGRQDFKIPMPSDGRFHGMCRNKLFVDAGTGPDNRTLFIFDVDKMVQNYSTSYCGELRIIGSQKLWFLMPVEESEVTKMPDCPDKDEWKKNGLGVGYGQQCIYNFMNRSLTRKSEWVCVPQQ